MSRCYLCVTYKRKRPNRQSRLSPMCIGRDDWIRTSDPLTPSHRAKLFHAFSFDIIRPKYACKVPR